MKKLLGIVMGISLVLGVAANAAADLTTGDFYGLVSDGTNEYVFDLDNIMDGADANKVDSGLTLASFTEASDWGDVDLFAGAYYASGSSLEGYNYFLGLNGVPTVDTISAYSFNGQILSAYYNNEAVDGSADVYKTTVTKNTALASEQNSFTGIEMLDLSAFDEGATEIVMDMYSIISNDWASTFTVTDLGTDFVLSLNTDGTLSAEIRAVPVPAAVWLLGSGLLGLIGIRRRNA